LGQIPNKYTEFIDLLRIHFSVVEWYRIVYEAVSNFINKVQEFVEVGSVYTGYTT